MSSLLSFSPNVADSLRTSPCNFVVTGANGWMGKATLDMLRQALGANFAGRVTALGSRKAQVSLADGLTFPIQPLLEWRLPHDHPAIIFHYAFLTMDKVNSLSEEEYILRNEAISSVVRGWIRSGDVRGVVMPSTGAVYDHLFTKSRIPAALLYGRLKYNDEIAFGADCQANSTGLIIPRVFNLSGPYINKFDSYALASFIFQILSARPVTIQARRPVIRSYYFIGDLIELCMRLLFRQTIPETECFDVAGEEVIEVSELAQRVAAVLADRSPTFAPRLPMLENAGEDRYVGCRDRIMELEISVRLHPKSLDAQISATSLYIESTLR